MSDTDRIAELERAVAFLAWHLILRDSGHAKPPEFKRLQEIADWVPRETAAIPITSPENRTP